MSDPLQELAKAARSGPARQGAQGAAPAPAQPAPQRRVEAAQPLDYGRPEPGVVVLRLSSATMVQFVGWLATWVGLGICALLTLFFGWALLESLFSGTMRPVRQGPTSIRVGGAIGILGTALFVYLMMMAIGAFVAVMGQMLLVLARRQR